MGKICIAFIMGLAMFTSAAWADDGNIFQPDDHCVAYVAGKRMFFVKHVEIVGKNCSVTARISPAGENFTIEIIAPVESFDSDNKKRDKHVAEIIGGEKKSPVIFRSEAMTRDGVIQILHNQRKSVRGSLFINGVEKPVEFSISTERSGNDTVIKPELQTAFSALGIKVPAVAGGFIVSPGDELKLVGQLRFPKVQGAEAFR